MNLNPTEFVGMAASHTVVGLEACIHMEGQVGQARLSVDQLAGQSLVEGLPCTGFGFLEVAAFELSGHQGIQVSAVARVLGGTVRSDAENTVQLELLDTELQDSVDIGHLLAAVALHCQWAVSN